MERKKNFLGPFSIMWYFRSKERVKGKTGASSWSIEGKRKKTKKTKLRVEPTPVRPQKEDIAAGRGTFLQLSQINEEGKKGGNFGKRVAEGGKKPRCAAIHRCLRGDMRDARQELLEKSYREGSRKRTYHRQKNQVLAGKNSWVGG